ncbi:hypothetical protein FA10DRAFT_266987 [Acaromyces ingoldii]|uniref:Uncharacterized protein n=1 Tax=Acaromyces ingoldii TaxID=215250 RepID=A0A316YR74_9BASI|nr:hypothetical protein FA10DRAFT_266987 [Acaromyces ingoldii]PWN90533.1 hypothetical protein FA10DRAFT_266987 [Acaromyces ingoldii]
MRVFALCLPSMTAIPLQVLVLGFLVAIMTTGGVLALPHDLHSISCAGPSCRMLKIRSPDKEDSMIFARREPTATLSDTIHVKRDKSKTTSYESNTIAARHEPITATSDAKMTVEREHSEGNMFERRSKHQCPNPACGRPHTIDPSTSSKARSLPLKRSQGDTVKASSRSES